MRNTQNFNRETSKENTVWEANKLMEEKCFNTNFKVIGRGLDSSASN
jgi:hypothetical protein